jgi:hypothetical protein
MRLMWCLLVVLTGLLGMLFWLLGSTEPAAATGMVHPTIPAMRIGGDGLARLGDQGWVLAGLQYLSLGVIYLLIALGVAPHRRTRLFWALLGFGFVLSIGVCWLMMSSYFQYLAGGPLTMLLGFPLPTTLMLYAIFLGGSYLCWLYCWGFDRFIFTAEDAAEYESLLADTEHLRDGSKH